MLVVYHPTYRAEGTAVLNSGFEGKTYTYHLQGIREEHGYHARHTSRHEPAAWRFLCFGFYHTCAYLLVGEEFYARIGEDAEECCGVTFEETADAIASIDVADGFGEARPVTLVFCEAGVACLEEDLDAVEGTNYCLSLQCGIRLACPWHK